MAVEEVNVLVVVEKLYMPLCLHTMAVHLTVQQQHCFQMMFDAQHFHLVLVAMEQLMNSILAALLAAYSFAVILDLVLDLPIREMNFVAVSYVEWKLCTMVMVHSVL